MSDLKVDLQLDRENDLAYILLRPWLRGQRAYVARSLRVTKDILLDLDADGGLIGIELFHASKHLGQNISEEKQP